jgi:ABC-2 type transport system permease protein
MNAFRIMTKDLRLIVRDRSALAFLLIVPIVVILVVAVTQSGEGTKSILFPVVNEDQGPVANVLIKAFRKHLDVQEVSEAQARRLVAVENQAAAALVLPRGMSKRYLTSKPSTIELFTDPAQWEELQAIKVIMLLADREAATLGDPFEQELLKIDERNITGTHLKFSSLEQNVPGFSLMFVLLTLIFSVSFGVREEEVYGTSARLAVAPISVSEVFAGKLMARVIIGVAQLLVLLLFAHFVFGLKLGHSPAALMVVAISIVFSMACFSVIVAAIARTREQVIPVGLSIMFLLAAVGGLWWPFYDQPHWMQVVGRGAMTTWSMFAIQDVILRDRTLTQVFSEVLVLIGYGIVSFAIGMTILRVWQNRYS